MRGLFLSLIALLGTVVLAFLFVPSPLNSSFNFLPSSLLTVLPSFAGKKDDRVSYRTAKAERGRIVTTVQAAGTLNALVTVDVGSQISGLITELYVDFNSAVTEGQVIARVEPETYAARVAQARAELEMAKTLTPVRRAQIERARAELETVKAAHASAKAKVLRQEVVLDDAFQNLERKRPLAERNVIAAGEWDQAQNAHRSAEAALAESQAMELSGAASVRSAEAALKMAEAQLVNTLAQVKQKETVLEQAQIDLNRTYIRAPVTGIVINRAVSSGQTLAASLQTPVLFTIAQDLREMQVEASVVEADISRFAVGQAVTFTVDAYPGRIFRGAVRQIRKAPEIVQNVVTYIVVIAAKNPDELLFPGMTANLRVIVAEREQILKVPNAALRFRPKGTAIQQYQTPPSADADSIENDGAQPGIPGRVFVLSSDGKPVAVPLRLGITDGRMTEVLQGELNEGQHVVVAVTTRSRSNTDTSSIQFKLDL